MVGDQAAQGRPDQGYHHGAVDRLEMVEQAFDLLVRLFQVVPASGDITAALATKEVQAHLDPVEGVATSVAETAQESPKAFDALRAIEDREPRSGELLFRRSIVLQRTHGVFPGRPG